MKGPKVLATEAIGFSHFMWVLSLDAFEPYLKFLGLDHMPPSAQVVARQFVQNQLDIDATHESLQSTVVENLMSNYSDKLRATVKGELYAKVEIALKLFAPDLMNIASRAWVSPLRAFAFRNDYPDPPIARDKATALRVSIREQLDPSVEEELLDLEDHNLSPWDEKVWHAYSAGFGDDIDRPTLANLIVDAIRSRSVQSILLEPTIAWSSDDCTLLEQWAVQNSQRISHAPSFVKSLPSWLQRPVPRSDE